MQLSLAPSPLKRRTIRLGFLSPACAWRCEYTYGCYRYIRDGTPVPEFGPLPALGAATGGAGAGGAGMGGGMGAAA